MRKYRKHFIKYQGVRQLILLSSVNAAQTIKECTLPNLINNNPYGFKSIIYLKHNILFID